ncbi:MAG: response regulator transcription factor [Tyzzerella sp.]|nr:response regulator transcription factor [Tyzzerella sp.]
MDLLRIGICDDEQHWHDEAKRIINMYASSIECPVELEFFGGKQELLGYSGKPLDAIFMDIELEQDNGIEVVCQINEKWPECSVIYVTNYLFYATDSYQTQHIYFVLKEQFERRIANIFNKILHQRKQVQNTLVFEVIGGTCKEVSLSPKDILYLERKKRRTQIHTIWGTYEVWDKIADIEKRLPEFDFVRCHNSYIVYLPAIRIFTMTSITMKDGVVIAVSRNYAMHTKTVFERWASLEML